MSVKVKKCEYEQAKIDRYVIARSGNYTACYRTKGYYQWCMDNNIPCIIITMKKNTASVYMYYPVMAYGLGLNAQLAITKLFHTEFTELLKASFEHNGIEYACDSWNTYIRGIIKERAIMLAKALYTVSVNGFLTYDSACQHNESLQFRKAEISMSEIHRKIQAINRAFYSMENRTLLIQQANKYRVQNGIKPLPL